MGSELILSALSWPRGATLHWDRMEAAVDDMSLEELNTGLDMVCSDVEEEDEPACREEVKEIFRSLKTLLAELPDDAAEITTKHAVVVVSGGMTWGDDPSDSFSTINDACWFPSVLRAVGFEMED